MFKKIFAVQLDLLITNNVFKTAKRKYSLPGYTKVKLNGYYNGMEVLINIFLG